MRIIFNKYHLFTGGVHQQLYTVNTRRCSAVGLDYGLLVLTLKKCICLGMDRLAQFKALA
jgi:hypothetical protein